MRPAAGCGTNLQDLIPRQPLPSDLVRRGPALRKVSLTQPLPVLSEALREFDDTKRQQLRKQRLEKGFFR
jgi:hypothetical protein